MRITFKDCIDRKRIIRFPEAKHLVNDEIKDSMEDLESAHEEFSKEGFKWATIKGYYSIFHSARALLHSVGYRERGHFCLYLAMKELFVKEGKMEAEVAEDLKNSMGLREDADYGRKFSKKGANATIKAAERFLSTAESILKK
ncbi:MAG: HEPN domain-containing protein [Candidatus Omnitrophica bacterium]|nr:HEPN domain-containing protein [Candidatus Omnitrophota bacterium]MBU1128008.1 HEPN domain-containing protein [Candidatus Omnitrophota bacterium]MBU1784181.1 HEPN domain-containing protein [Candidatus Omnitrophota bacterium]MBU1850889.1 HEPN domain-containing protein [Candidatus Omnitrophota bacterium]